MVLSDTVILLSDELQWLTFFAEGRRRSRLPSRGSSGQAAADERKQRPADQYQDKSRFPHDENTDQINNHCK